jgi:hypothetical protein
MKRIILAAAVSTLMIGATVAQETATARPGEEVRLGWIGSIGQNCKPNPAPKVEPSSVAGNGQIKLMQGEVKTNSIAQCPGVKIPVILVFYKSSKSFEGEDRFVLSVQEKSGTTQRTYTIQVKGEDGSKPTKI